MDQSMRCSSLISRATVLGTVILVHAIALAGFLSRWHVGLATELQSDTPLSQTQAPMIASIVSLGPERNHGPADLGPPSDSLRLFAKQISIDIPIPAPVWPPEDDGQAATAAPHPAAGRTGRYCEVHIHQSPQGRLQAVDFGECTGDVVWQRTLLETIERAARLLDPAPGAHFPAVRTFTVRANGLSAVVLAQQLP